MDNQKYNSNQNYCSDAQKKQSVLSNEDTIEQKPWLDNESDIYNDRLNTKYSCPDNYKMGSIQDNQIYIATTDDQHSQIVQGQHVDAQGGLSGYFSDQATVDACKTEDTLDNTQYNEMCQIAPYRNGGIEDVGDATYKPHVDCFETDRDALHN